MIFLERELFSDGTFDIEQRFREVAGTMLLDVDDATFLLHPEKFDVLARMCDAIIVGNELLRQKAQPLNDNVTVIPTCVDLERYPMNDSKPLEKGTPIVRSRSTTIVNGESGEFLSRKQGGPPTNRPWRLGWTGTAANLKYLALIQNPLKELAKRYPIELRIIAESRRPLRQLDLRGVDVRFVRWNEKTEIKDLRRFDIGLMPMPDTDWTRYKCGLKILQYMALGIPTVASPVGVNTDIIRHEENGFCADSFDEWKSVLTSLITDPDKCDQIIRAGRRTVEESYAVQNYAPKLAATLESAIQRV